MLATRGNPNSLFRIYFFEDRIGRSVLAHVESTAHAAEGAGDRVPKGMCSCDHHYT